MVIEIDGGYHHNDNVVLLDASREEYLKQFGLIVVRIDNDDICKNFNEVCFQLDLAIKYRLEEISKR